MSRWISYAQNGEDVVLARVLADVDAGFWIDVGAQDPRMDSVTCAFAERGWRGINIEPVPRWHAALVAARPRDVNLAVAAGEAEARLPFFEVADSGLSTLDPRLAGEYRDAGHVVREHQIQVRTLAAICAEHVRGPVHFLKIDAEGAEGAVLRGMDFDAVRPWVVLVEATAPNSRVSTHAAWEPVLRTARYAFAYSDGINRFYLAEERAALADRFGPPTVLDESVRREQVDALADAEARLEEVESLSRRRAEELETHAARIVEKDVALAEWQARWQAEAAEAARLRAAQADADARAGAAQAAHDALAVDTAATAAELGRMHHEAAALQAALAAADARAGAAHEAMLAADARAAEAREGMAAADARAAAATVAQVAADARARAAEAAAVAADARTRAVHAQLESSLSELGRLQAALTAAEMRDADARARLEATAARLASTEDALARLAAQVPDLQAQLRAATAGHVAAHAELLRHVGLIDGMRAEHAVVLASRSWRLTAPLRAANALASRLRAAVTGVPIAPRIASQDAGAGAATARPIALSEDAERILAQAPVLGRNRD